MDFVRRGAISLLTPGPSHLRIRNKQGEPHLDYLEEDDEPYCGTISNEPITCPLILIPTVMLAVKLLVEGMIDNVEFMRADTDDRSWK